MAHGFITFTDHTGASASAGSRLFGGSEIKAWVQRVSVTSQNNIDTAFRPNQQMEFNSDTATQKIVAEADNNNVGSNWNRRKSHTQNSGMENFQITMEGGWSTSEVGSADATFGTGSPVNLSPYKVARMAMSGHTFYIKGGTVIQSLIDGEANDILAYTGTQVGSLYTGSGIPVQIATWSLNDEVPNSEYVTWTLTLIEDKDRENFTN